LWPTHTIWEQWSNPVLMVLYGISGLFFALRFLDLRAHFPRVHKAVLTYIGAAALALALSVVFGSQRNALLVAFSFVSLFTVIMLGLGAISLRSGQKPARYFLLAAISAMVGVAVTALCVWGFLPFNTWTFHAVDLGVMLDATLLALALTYQVRVGQQERQRAEALAKVDPLTGLDNRRAFYDKATPVWKIALRHDHALSVILLDIDGFKRINDTYGHACGDEVLTLTAAALRGSVRGEDLVTRWGGEEFLLLLPETGLEAAAALAERLRRAIIAIRLHRDGDEIRVTASFGVAQRETQHRDLDALISRADSHLYHSKDAGRNRVTHA
jgi:two-component system, sensor histidine kinase LadS